MSEHGREMAKNASVVAGATLISRVLGFVRDVIVAFTLGTGLFADAFFVAFRIPNLLRRLFGEGSLTMAFIPIYTRVREEEGEEAAQALARSAMAWLAAILIGLTLLVELLAGPLTFAIAPGFAKNPELFSATVDMVRICFPYVILICGVALCMGILNASKHFLAPALAPTILNVALIAAALFGWAMGLNVAYVVSFGVLAAGMGQWLLQQPFLRRVGFSWRGQWSWRNRHAIQLGLLLLPTVFGAAVYQLNILLGTLLASFLPTGSVSYLYYADRLVQFPLGVFGIAISTAALPSLAALAAKKDFSGFDRALSTAQGLTLFIALPAAAGLLALAHPVIGLLFQRGAFTSEAVAATASALMAYSVGLPFIALARPLIAGFYAMEDTRTPVRVAVFCLAANIGLGYWLMHPLAHVGLALAVSLSSVLNFGLLHLLMAKKRGTNSLPFVPALKTLVLSVGVGAAAYATASWSLWSLLLIPVWAVCYIFLARVLNMDEALLFVDMLSHRIRRGRKKSAPPKE